MNNEITPEQTEKIAEWLGFKVYLESIDGRRFWGKEYIKPIDYEDAQISMKRWLSSPEGEITMTHKLLEPDDWNLNIGSYASGYRVRVRNFSDENDEIWVNRHEDLNKALQLVILEMLKRQTL